MEVNNSPFAHLPFIILLDGPLKCCSIFLLGAWSTTVIYKRNESKTFPFLFLLFMFGRGRILIFSECQHLWTVETLLLKAVLPGGNAWFLRSIVMVAFFDKGCILRSLTIIKLNCILSSLSLISVELFTKGLKVKGGKESLFYVGSSK